jgi:membrane associated rhomboid family serine protease
MLGAPRLTKAVAWLVGIEVGMFLIYLFGGASTRAGFVDWLGVTGRTTILHGRVWTIFTASLFNVSGMAFFFDMLMLWLFVPVLENWWGEKRFIVFLIATSAVGNAVSALVGLGLAPDHLVVGLSPFVYATIVAYGVLFANQPVQLFGVLPIRGRQLAIGTVCFVALFVLIEQAWVDGAGFFSAMALAYLMTSGVWTPQLWWLKWRHARLRKRYTVIQGGIDDKKQRWMN